MIKEKINEKEKEKKERKYSVNYFFYRYNHKKVVITLLNNEKKKGTLHVNEKNWFDVLLNNENEEIFLIPKHSILYIELLKEKMGDKE